MLKRITAALTAAILLLSLVSCTIESNQQHYTQSQTGSSAGTALISIDCKTVLSNFELLDESLKTGDFIPKDGVILKKTELQFADGDSVLDLLKKAVKENKIQMEYQGADQNSVGAAYIESLGYLYEFSCGEKSGWFFSVNGKFPSNGCDSVKLKDGDRVNWVYSCDLGRDIGAKLE